MGCVHRLWESLWTSAPPRGRRRAVTAPSPAVRCTATGRAHVVHASDQGRDLRNDKPVHTVHDPYDNVVRVFVGSTHRTGPGDRPAVHRVGRLDEYGSGPGRFPAPGRVRRPDESG